MADVATGVAAVKVLQSTLLALTALGLTHYQFPTDTDTTSLPSQFNYIVIGSGPGGSVVASRLSEDANNTVLLIEAGGVPPLESVMPGLFTMQPNSKCDWNRTSVDDGYSNQNMVDKVAGLTGGKMLGGSSSIDHMIYVRGNPNDYSNWVDITGDDSWSHENLMPYFKKCENVLDLDVLNDYASYHGTDGPLKLTRQPSATNTPILGAFGELDHDLILDINANVSKGYTEPLLAIADTYRQSAALAYLFRAINRTNLYVKFNTQATRILFDSNNKAYGVEILDSDSVNKTVTVTNEIIVSAGAINTPQLLMLSGIGPKDQLESLGIEVIADLPVGQNLTDHVAAVTVYTLDESTSTVVSNPHEFPVPTTTGYVALNSSEYPDYQSINLIFPPASSGLTQLCAWVFKYSNDVCQKFYDANLEKAVMFTVNNVLQPISRGQVQLNSTDPSIAPIVTLGLLSSETDLNVLAQSLMDFNAVVNTTYFTSVNSELVNLNLTNCNDIEFNTLEFWTCYGKEMSSTMWHYSSTCAMGTVLDSDLTVKNVTGLRVVDASAMPGTISGNIMGAIYALAEKGADLILAANS